jgi:SAM-dependent methyltransferase
MKLNEGFNPEEYWKSRLHNKVGLDGVGYNGLDAKANSKLYKIRGYGFKSLVKKYIKGIQNKDVLDIGSGTGFYINLWVQFNAHKITGFDITDVACARLRQAYPDCNFEKVDITEKSQIRNYFNQFDVISIMDVIFHIVDDSKLPCAIENIALMLKKGSYLVFSDFLLKGASVRKKHIVFRNEREVIELLEKYGLRVVELRPLFYFLNDPIDTTNYFLKRIFYKYRNIAGQRKWLGNLILTVIYPIELIILRFRKSGPSTKIVICRKV